MLVEQLVAIGCDARDQAELEFRQKGDPGANAARRKKKGVGNMRNTLGCSFAARPLRAARTAILGFAALMGACSDAPDDASDDFQEEEDEVGSLEQPLFDSDDIRTTAGSALVVAYDRTLADGDLFEYCGLIVRKADGNFRAGDPTTSGLPRFCAASINFGPGESIVGYYHTHTRASAPELSPDDIDQAEATGRVYFVLSTLNGCGQSYDPATNTRSNLGCPFG